MEKKSEFLGEKLKTKEKNSKMSVAWLRREREGWMSKGKEGEDGEVREIKMEKWGEGGGGGREKWKRKSGFETLRG